MKARLVLTEKDMNEIQCIYIYDNESTFTETSLYKLVITDRRLMEVQKLL